MGKLIKESMILVISLVSIYFMYVFSTTFDLIILIRSLVGAIMCKSIIVLMLIESLITSNITSKSIVEVTIEEKE